MQFPLSSLYEVARYTNPVSHRTHLILRRRHDRVHSQRLLHYRSCMHQELEGRHYRGGTPAQDERAVRHAFREAAHTCATRDKVYPSDRRH